MSHETVIDRFIAALESGDLEGVMRCYTPDARIWHNFDQIETSAAENAVSVAQFIKMLPERRYTNIRRSTVDGSVIQQHLIIGTSNEGKRVEWPGCIVFAVQNDRIARIEEYVDILSLTKQL